MNNMIKRYTFLFLIIWVYGTLTVFAEEKTVLKTVSFIPHWSPQAQFAGYYIAKEKGFYEKHGLNVQIIEGGPDKLTPKYLLDKKADFAVMWLSQGIQQRTKGKRIVNIAPNSTKIVINVNHKKRKRH